MTEYIKLDNKWKEILSVYKKVNGEWILQTDINSSILASNIIISKTNIIINKTNPIYTAPTSKSNLVYNGEAQELVNAGSTNDGTIKYSLDNSTWSTSIPTGTNANSYSIYWKLEGDGNHNDVSSTLINVTISKANITSYIIISDWTYGGTASNPSISGNSGNGNVTYTYKVSTAADSTYTSTKPSNAGTYTVRAVIDATSNYNGTTVTNTFTINKVTPTVIAPTAKVLTYNGSAQELINAGSTNYGTLKYAISEGISLPYDSQIEYLEGDGRQYINTTIVPNSSTGIYMEYIPYKNNYYGYNDMFLIGTRNDTGNTRWILGKSGTDGKATLYYGYGGYAYLTDTRPPVSSFITATLNYLNSKTATVSINNVSSGSRGLSNTLSFVPSNPIRIFGSSGVNASYSKGAMRLYACKISQGTDVILDLIPVRKNGIGYMYDKISGNLYGNNGTGTFGYGADVNVSTVRTYSTSIPTATNAGSYTVYYKVEGDSNVNSIEETSIQCSISENNQQ